MKITKLMLLSLPLLLIAACAGKPSAPAVADTTEARVECEKTYRTGTLMPKKDCSPPVSEAERERLQVELSRIQPPASQGPGK